jgi:hypothetical protein
MMKTQQQDAVAEGLRKAVVQAALDGADEESAVGKKPDGNGKPRAVGKGGVPVPNGRPKGVKNKITTTIRDAVMDAFQQVGGPAYLVRLAEGTQSDRAAFTSLLNKVLPTQVNAQVEGGIKLELSWLGQRQIGTVRAQELGTEPEKVTQVIDLERDSKGKYRIANPLDAADGVSPEGVEGSDGLGGAKRG